MAEGYIHPALRYLGSELGVAAIQRLMALRPGWVPNEGHLEVQTLEIVGRMVGEARSVASAVPRLIFRDFGRTLMNLPPVMAAPARVSSTWTAIDDAGYTVESGTLVMLRRSGDELVPFMVESNVVIPPGLTTTEPGAVTLVALEPGTEANALPIQITNPADTLAWVAQDGVATTTLTTGGVDAESEASYLNRLAEELRLMTPRPIHAEDFAVLAKRVASVHRAMAVDGLNPGRTVTGVTRTNASAVLTKNPGGDFTAADVGRSVTGTGIPGGTTVLSYQSSVQVTMSANATSGGVGTITLGNLTNQERTVAVAVVNDAGEAVSNQTKAEVAAYLDALREVNFVVIVVDPAFTVVDVAVSFEPEDDVSDPAALETDVEAAINAWLSPATWGGGDEDPPSWDATATSVEYLELATLINNVTGVKRITALTLNKSGDAPGSVNVALTGVAPLPQPGVVAATAV